MTTDNQPFSLSVTGDSTWQDYSLPWLPEPVKPVGPRACQPLLPWFPTLLLDEVPVGTVQAGCQNHQADNPDLPAVRIACQTFQRVLKAHHRNTEIFQQHIKFMKQTAANLIKVAERWQQQDSPANRRLCQDTINDLKLLGNQFELTGKHVEESKKWIEEAGNNLFLLTALNTPTELKPAIDEAFEYRQQVHDFCWQVKAEQQQADEVIQQACALVTQVNDYYIQQGQGLSAEQKAIVIKVQADKPDAV